MSWFSTTSQKTNAKKRAKCTSHVFEVVEMKRNKSNSKFWPVLTTVNIVTLVYPINLLLRANSVDENLFAAFALIGLVFLLMVVDAVSILVAEEVGITRR